MSFTDYGRNDYKSPDGGPEMERNPILGPKPTMAELTTFLVIDLIGIGWLGEHPSIPTDIALAGITGVELWATHWNWSLAPWCGIGPAKLRLQDKVP
jgi:hypothetical protein